MVVFVFFFCFFKQKTVVFPGDVLSIESATGRRQKARIGRGLTPAIVKENTNNNQPTTLYANNKEGILVTRPGVLQNFNKNLNHQRLWVVSKQQRVL